MRRNPPSQRAVALVLSCLLTLACLSAQAAETKPAALTEGELTTLQQAFIRVAKASTPKTVLVRGLIGLGTGAILDAKGTVVTNAHVAAGARYAIIVFANGTSTLYQRLGIDYKVDLALLEPVTQLEKPTAYFEWAALERPAAGTWVAALGYPGGPRGDAAPMFTVGQVIDGKGLANVNGFLDYSDAIRTNVPIYSGNSGGPLVDLQGRLVGINGAVDMAPAITSDSEYGVGSLTIPAAIVTKRIRHLKGGIVFLPGDITLDPASAPWLGWLDDKLDTYVHNLMDKVFEAGNLIPEIDKAATVADIVNNTSPQALPATNRIVDGWAKHNALSSRNRLLTSAAIKFSKQSKVRSAKLTTDAGATVLATRVPGLGYLVFVPRGTNLRTSAGLKLAASHSFARYGLKLYRPAGAGPAKAPSVATATPPVGQLVLALTPTTPPFAVGVVSAAPRSIPVNPAALVLARTNERTYRWTRGALKAVEVFGSEEVAELATTLRRAMEVRAGFSAGTTPRSFPQAYSFDAPVGPSSMGAPVLTFDGAVVGIVGGVAHHGTSYIIPLSELVAELNRPKDATLPKGK